MSDLDDWVAKRRGGQTAAPATPQPSAPAGGSDLDAWVAKRRQAQPSRPAVVLPQDRQTFNRPRGLGIENVTGIQPSAPPQGPGLGENVAIGAERGYRKNLKPSINSLAEVTEGMKVGNFGPAWQIAKEAGRGILHSLKPPDPQFKDGMLSGLRPADPALQQAQQRREARYAASPEGRQSRMRLAELDERAALDPSYTGKAVRGVSEFATGAAPTLAAAIASRGAILPTALTAGLQSANNPGMMGPQAAASMLPAPSVAPLVRRLRGRGAAPQLARGQAAPEVAPTQRPPVEPVRPAQQPTPALPVRERISELPELSAEVSDFGVRANLNAPRQYAGAVGPRTEIELGFRAPAAKPKASQPPTVPPDIDASLEKWKRQPQQAPLFEASAKSPWQDSVLAYYRANLLTNPVGRAADLGSTVINQFADAAVRPIAAAVDVIVSKLTGQRSITGPSLSGTGRAFGSIRQGLRDARDVMRTGKQTIDSGADDVLYGSEIRTGLGKGVDAPINGVFRILGALDAPFRRFGFERNLADRARVAAINEAKRGRIPGDQVKARAAQLVDDDRIIAAAVRDGERAVLSEPNRVSSWLSNQTRNSPNARLAIGIVQPFMRIPLNSILRSADFAGVGGIKALYKIARGVGRKTRGQSFFRDLEEQRVFAQNVASGSFAPAAFLLGMELEDQGKLEGYYFTSKNDRPNGRVPTSIEFGGERYDVNRLGGFIAAPLFIGATYNRLRKQGSDQANSLLRSFSGLAQQAPALGYYGAPAKAGRILTADEPGSEIIKEAGSIASGFIPASGASGAVAKAIDKNRKREAEGFTGPIMSRIPGLRSQLPEKPQGAALKRQGGYAAKLKEHGIESDFIRPMKGEPEGLFAARRQRIEAWSDKYGNALVNNPGFSRLTASQQKAAIKSLQSNIREEANDREPNLGLFEPGRTISAVQESERTKAERNRRKFYVPEE